VQFDAAGENLTDKPLRSRPAPTRVPAAASAEAAHYRPLPSGSHGLDPGQVRRDQRQRLRAAMIELIAAKGYPGVRIADLAKLAHVSPPTLYSLYADKEELFIGTYEDVARRVGATILRTRSAEVAPRQRLLAAMIGFAELAAREPEAISLLVLGAFGAGPRVLRKRAAALDALELFIRSHRAPGAPVEAGDLTVRAMLGGIREITATRLRDGRQRELPGLAAALSGWASSYPSRLPPGLAAPDADASARAGSCTVVSQRTRRAPRRLPSGRSDLPRAAIVKSQQERIVDATAAIVAEKGLPRLTIPEIVGRANVSNQTFYAIYRSKREAFLGAQKVGMHQALTVAGEAYAGHGEDWPRAVAAGIEALLDYLAAEPAHAHLTLVDTFAASPEAIAIRQDAMAAFSTYFAPGFGRPGAPASSAGQELVAEAVVGGIWQILHHYIEKDAAAALPAAAAQLTYFALTPFLGAAPAAALAAGG
jgi:AcrR family transcriptional regulator